MKADRVFDFAFRTFPELLPMNTFRLSQVMLGAALSMAMFSPSSAHAALSDSKVCPKLSPEVSAPPGVQAPEVCYSGFNCTVGMRGDWLDITNRVSMGFTPGPITGQTYANAEASIAARGVEIRASNACVPVSQRDREGYVAVLLEEVKGAGKARVKASRPGLAGIGSDSDSVEIEVRDGTHYLHPVQRAALSARVGEVKTIDLNAAADACHVDADRLDCFQILRPAQPESELRQAGHVLAGRLPGIHRRRSRHQPRPGLAIDHGAAVTSEANQNFLPSLSNPSGASAP